MEIFIETDKTKLQEYTKIYEENIFPFVESFKQEIKKNNYTDELRPSVQRDVLEYVTFLQWPIRKLEYSFMLKNCKDFLKPQMRTLDGGCGVTPTVRWFADQGCEAYATDELDKTIKYLQNPESHLFNPKVNFSVQDLTSLNFEDNFFDAVTCISVLEHIKPGSDTKAISELIRVLKPGGKLILTVDFGGKDKKYLVKTGIDYIKKGKVRQMFAIMKRNRMMLSQGPYTFENLLKYVINPFKNYLVGEIPQNIDLSQNEIRNFWKTHWTQGCMYDKNEGRSYVAVGMVFEK